MKNCCVLFFILFFASTLNAQPIDKIINAKEVERIESILSSDAMEGRRVFTPGIEKAAAFIESEFSQIGLQKLDNSKSYLQSFSILRPKLIGLTCSFDGVSVDSKDVIVVTCNEHLEVNEQSGF